MSAPPSGRMISAPVSSTSERISFSVMPKI
jgi:hypothetical protein